jgi:ribosomal protein L22
MKARAVQNNIHVSSRKANLVADLIRHRKVIEALTILDNVEKKMGRIFKKLLNGASANATNNHQMNGESLYIYEVTANQGKTIKRSLPRAKGSAHMIRKRHSNIVIVLSDDKQQKAKDLLALKTHSKHRPNPVSSDKKIISKVHEHQTSKASSAPKIILPTQTVEQDTHKTKNETNKHQEAK